MSARNTAVFGVYPNETELAEALEELKRHGFRTTDFSMLLPENLGSKDIGHEKHTKAPEGAVAGGICGAVVGGALAWLSHAGVITIPITGADTLIAAGLAMVILAGVGAFGALGAVLGAFAGGLLPEYEAKRYEGRTRSGGVLLSVHCDSADWRLRAKETLRHTGARGIASAVESKADFGASEKPKLRMFGSELPRHRSFLQPADSDSPLEQSAEARRLNTWHTERSPLG
jgi:hypothetical protein